MLQTLRKMASSAKAQLLRCLRGMRRVVDEISIAIKYSLDRGAQRSKRGYRLYRKLNLPDWYHDFSVIGITTRRFRDGGYDLSQQDKEPILFDFIKKASQIVKARGNGVETSPAILVDLFCADAYYSIFALHRNLFHSAVGVDFEEGSGEGFIRGGVLEQAETISNLCGLQDRLALRNCDVMNYEGNFDVCLCIGGLYHIADPLGLLRRVTAKTSCALVIQTVIPSNVSEDVPFFVTPAPHWTWGCRFNKKYLVESLEGLGWTVSALDVRPMRANIHLWDALSLSLLCVKGPR